MLTDNCVQASWKHHLANHSNRQDLSTSQRILTRPHESTNPFEILCDYVMVSPTCRRAYMPRFHVCCYFNNDTFICDICSFVYTRLAWFVSPQSLRFKWNPGIGVATSPTHGGVAATTPTTRRRLSPPPARKVRPAPGVLATARRLETKVIPRFYVLRRARGLCTMECIRVIIQCTTSVQYWLEQRMTTRLCP